MDYNNLAQTLKENTSSAVRDLLGEAVRKTYAELLSEDDDKDYEEEEVEDTTSTATDSEDVAEDDFADGKAADSEGDDLESDGAGEDDDLEMLEDEGDALADEPEEGDEEWSEFDKFKVGDNEYDFSDADDEEIVKVYKLLKDDDQVLVRKDDNKVSIADNETGAEYLIDLGNDNETELGESFMRNGNYLNEEEIDVPSTEEVFDAKEKFNNGKDFEELDAEEDFIPEGRERVYEITLNEYNSNVGYTDNYQKKDVMTNPGMSEPAKNANDWDAGVPKGTEKPWSGFKNKKGNASAPFNDADGKTVEEATNVGGFVQQNTTSKSHVPNSSGRSARNASKGGRKIKGTPNPRYANDADVDETITNESIMRRANKIFKENKELKNALGKFRNVLKEAAVTNVNLGQIIKLISENATSKDEKQEIIARFGREAKTVEQSKNLYETISNELKKAGKLQITESAPLSATGSQKINETQIYKSKDLVESLDLMHKLCK